MRGQAKVGHQYGKQLSPSGTVSEAKEKRGDTVLTEMGSESET